MEISTTAATIPATVKTPETESEARARIQPTKPLSSTNGVLKRHQPLHHYHPYTNNHIPVVVIYKDCLKNHAASLGGHAVDGCGEFMPSSSSNPTDPTSLKCAACGCHRNFHRREPEEPLPLPLPPPNTTTALEYKPLHRHHPPPPASLPRGGSTPNSPSPPPISSSYYPSAPHMLLALSASVPGHPADTPTAAQTTPAAAIANSNGSRKRFRTKFTQNQKERMFEFAERVGWKIQKRDEELISEFCGAVGVDKGVLKVWMHNNKNTSGKKDNSNNNIDGSSIGTIGLIDGKTSIIDPITSTDYHHHQDHNDDAATATTCEIFGHQHHNNDSVSPPAVAANGSSSSS